METVNQLETDLVQLRVREAECHSALRDAKERNRLLEEVVYPCIYVQDTHKDHIGVMMLEL